MRGQNGITYQEIMIVVVILNIVAVSAVPSISSIDPKKLDVAAQTIADAIVFARAESIRTKTPHGINADVENQRIRVYSLPGETAIYNVYHPINKKIYDIQLRTDAQLVGVSLDSAYFSYEGLFSSSSNFDFNVNGMPKYTGGFPQRDYMLTSAEITLSFHEQQRVISIAPTTGRVKVQ